MSNVIALLTLSNIAADAKISPQGGGQMIKSIPTEAAFSIIGLRIGLLKSRRNCVHVRGSEGIK